MSPFSSDFKIDCTNFTTQQRLKLSLLFADLGVKCYFVICNDDVKFVFYKKELHYLGYSKNINFFTHKSTEYYKDIKYKDFFSITNKLK